MATLDQVTQAVNAGSRARALIASQSPALLGQIRMPAYSLDPNNNQPQVNPQTAPGGGTDTQLGGDSGLAPDWQQDPNTGIWYDATTGTPAPEWMQKQLNGGSGPQVSLPGGGSFGDQTTPGDQSFNIYGENAVYGSGGEQLPYTQNPNINVPLSDPRAGQLFGMDEQTYQNITALHDAGIITDAQYRAMLMGNGGGSGGGGGGGSPYAAQQMELQQQQFQHTLEQDRLQNILDVLNATRQQQVLMTQARDNAQAALISAAPNLNDGRQYFGGYEPGGPAQALADFGGYAFTPQPLQTVPITFNPNPVAVDPATQAILDRILGAQQA